MPDNFWFKVESPADVLGTDGETVVGRLEPGIAYRATDANDHWLAIPGPNGTRGFVAIHDLVYEELAIPWNHAEPESEDADPDQDERDEERVEARSLATSRSSWMAMGAGPESVVCPGGKGTAPA